ncbi:methyltransferase [Neptunicella sp. SCSIO 80796]|uniref:methyltransferase n=1 Tax=Neptunicella plasticusilytica TaxID=3117012 RepID=UPI003A4E6426
MLSAPSQLLIKNQTLFTQGKWLLVNPEDTDIFTQLDANLDGFYQYFDIYQQAEHLPGQHSFAASLESNQQYDGVIVYMPKAKAQAQMLLANMANMLKTGGSLWLVGENKGGIKAAPKLLAPFSDQIVKQDAARHCSLFRCTINKPVKPFNLKQWQTEFEININDCQLKICSLPGVFNHGALDTGSRLLLESIHTLPNGKLLDFACGAGIVGCYLASKNPAAQILMSDINALALHCARQTAELNNIDASIIASNGLNAISDKFSAIYTNPPFHTGTKTDYQVSEQFIANAKKALTAKGSLTLVANAFLKYPELLQTHLSTVKVLAETSKFKVYHCQL